MSTAEKLVTVAENVERVYNAGFEAGKAEGGSIPEGMEWINHNTRVVFDNDDWASEEQVVYLPNVNYFASLFQNAITKIKVLTIKSDVPIIHAGNFLSSSTSITQTLERLILECDFSQCPYFNKFLQIQRKLIRIEGVPIDFSSCTSGIAFEYTNNLTSFRVAPLSIKCDFALNTSPNIDDETIQSVVDGLADLTGLDSKVLSVHSKVKARIEANPVWLASITEKNWTLA